MSLIHPKLVRVIRCSINTIFYDMVLYDPFQGSRLNCKDDYYAKVLAESANDCNIKAVRKKAASDGVYLAKLARLVCCYTLAAFTLILYFVVWNPPLQLAQGSQSSRVQQDRCSVSPCPWCGRLQYPIRSPHGWNQLHISRRCHGMLCV